MMKDTFKQRWANLSPRIRKPLVLFVGLFFVIAAGLTGWLPGPGGIPLFLVGVAILATEYSWAERLKKFTLRTIHRGADWLRRNPAYKWLVISAVAVMLSVGVYELLRRLS
jgi:uncharacterized protein (TIGR02611 family)